MPKLERTFRTDAVILRRQDFGEADRLLTILTPGHGKLRAVAKGAPLSGAVTRAANLVDRHPQAALLLAALAPGGAH